ncbi:MAG: TlyA family RNA methyltransferase [Clostridia bacterium]|nr:TlyA family RNA methyltransferase [Clostridia bacterium]
MRLDLYLTENGLASTRSRAKLLIDGGSVFVNGISAEKAAYDVKDGDAVTVENALRYVSRGGLKLEAALQRFSVSPAGVVALDVGASSGGFTDCLLQNGARFVYAVDSGSGQLAATLRGDPRVDCRENYNARYMQASDFPTPPTLAVMDVSFISQTLILPALAAVLPTGSRLISLVKPQFEVGRALVGRGGLVRDEKARQAAIARVKEAGIACGFRFVGVMTSPITGGDGNIEYLICFEKSDEKKV